MTVTRYLGGTRRKLADWAGIQKQDPRTKVGKTLDFHSSNTSLPRLPSRNAMPATGESKLWVVYNCFLRKHVQQRPTDKTSFWMQFEKRGRGLLQEAEWDWGRVSYWLKARRGIFFPPRFQPTNDSHSLRKAYRSNPRPIFFKLHTCSCYSMYTCKMTYVPSLSLLPYTKVTLLTSSTSARLLRPLTNVIYLSSPFFNCIQKAMTFACLSWNVGLKNPDLYYYAEVG